MLNDLFSSILSSETAASALSVTDILTCTIVSLILGFLIALFYTFRSSHSKSFVVTLALLPAIVQMVIMLVNGNLGTGVAVMGAFSLVRFRSVPGSAREICSIFLAMAVGLATGMGYLAVAALFVIVMGTAGLIYTVSGFGRQKQAQKELKITIPESLDYTDVFDDLMQKYTGKWELMLVRTTNMGSLYRLEYLVTIKDQAKEKEFLDALRCRNGNLEISCGRVAAVREEL